MGEYSPVAHVNDMGVHVIYADLPDGMTGEYVHSERLIKLAWGLGPIQKRSVLAHEAVHAEYGDEPTPLTWRQIEWRADRIAAARLIDANHLHDLMKWKPGNPEEWCKELRVTPHLLGVYRRCNVA